MEKCVTIQVTGKVQGVWFRKSAQDMAKKLSIKGYAKNNVDGTVTIEACGEKKNLDKMIAWCRKGSRLAKVENIMHTYSDKKHRFDDFSIL